MTAAAPDAPAFAAAVPMETMAGAQALRSGRPSLTGSDRLRWRADAPLAARGTPRPCNPGLSGRAARDQRARFPKLPPGSPDG